jgi:uncharacterized protein (DUF1330 family)
MPAYIIVDIEIHDPETYAAYRELAPPSIATFGGRYLARGGRTEPLEGTWSPSRFVILEFPSTQQARAWWESTDYAEARRLRQESATTQMLLVEGLDVGARP